MSRQAFLKRTLDTKDLRDANIRAKPIVIAFDKILAQADAMTVQPATEAELVILIGIPGGIAKMRRRAGAPQPPMSKPTMKAFRSVASRSSAKTRDVFGSSSRSPCSFPCFP
jgi:hypothetical protein